MKRLLRYVSICIIAALIPFAAFVIVGESVKNNYENVFTASLVDKYERLNAINEQKIVFVGGSSLPFGLRCDLIERELDIKAVDLGVYAALGTKAMMEISLANLNSGDIVVLAPELSAQTYSLYFNADATWEALNEKREIIGLLDGKERIDMAYNYFDYLFNKIRISGEAGVAASELYSRTSFNDYGDLSYPREGNIMAGGYDKSRSITLDILNDDFLQYVRQYVDYLNKKCVDVYFTFSPTNALAVGFTVEEAADFERDLPAALHCKLLGRVESFTYDAEYFYNTNYHLNDRGALLNTKNIIDLLKAEFNINAPTDIVIPDKEDGGGIIAGEDENERYFYAEERGGTLYLTGVREDRRDNTELTLPKTYGGKTVSAIAGGCFKGCVNLGKLTIPNNYRMFDSGIFEGCASLKDIYLETENPGTTSIPDSGLFDGAAADLKVYDKPAEYTAFLSNYSWGEYRKWIVKWE